MALDSTTLVHSQIKQSRKIYQTTAMCTSKKGETNWSPVYVNTIEKDGQEMFN